MSMAWHSILNIPIVTDSSYVCRATKQDLCCSLGASAFIDLRERDMGNTVLELTSSLGAHAVINCAGSEISYSQAIKLLRRGGTLVCVGLPSNKAYCLPINPMEMVVRGLHVVGSSVGTEEEMQELLQLAKNGEVVPRVDVLPLERYREAIQMVKTSRASGKVVLEMP